MKIRQHFASHMTKMAAMPKYGKTLKNLLSRNHWVDFDEALYEASEIKALYYLCKLLPWVDLDLFYVKENFCNFGFYMGKCDNDVFFGNYFIL